ncbi:MAG: ComEC/Rec2 family competence protein [Patescibacteria group bacterium]|jgi:competence protein ComEC
MSFFKYYYTVLILVPVLVLRVFLFCDCNFKDCQVSRTAREEDQDVFTGIRRKISDKVHKKLPSPHGEILLGMTTGINEFADLHKFYDVLCNVGTVHVVVVSGFNITLVFSFVGKVLGSLYRLKNLLIGQVVVFMYALFSGFDPPVVRALFMGSIVHWGRYYGRDLGALRILLFSAQVMMLIDPKFLFSLSFQLSFLSTLSLMLFSGAFGDISMKLFGEKIDDLISTLAAVVLVWPLVSMKFGRVSLVSPLVNLLVLWTVPVATVLGTALIILEMLLDLPSVFWYPAYFLIDIFVRVCRYFESIPLASLGFELKPPHMMVYYSVVMIYPLWKGVRSCRHS